MNLQSSKTAAKDFFHGISVKEEKDDLEKHCENQVDGNFGVQLNS